MHEAMSGIAGSEYNLSELGDQQIGGVQPSAVLENGKSSKIGRRWISKAG